MSWPQPGFEIDKIRSQTRGLPVEIGRWENIALEER